MNQIDSGLAAKFSGTNLERAADHNQRVTLHAIRVAGALTRVELSETTGLTPPAIANITRRLLAGGLIQEAGQRRGKRGQPPTRLTVRPEAAHAIGVNVDRDHITFVLVDFAGQTLARDYRAVDYALPADVAALYAEVVPAMIASSEIDATTMVGIGVALPDDLGSIELPGRPDSYAQWQDVNLQDLFAAPLHLPVFVENDAAAAAMGEMQLGSGQRHASFFYILVSSGLGGGLVVNGNYVRGATGRSGEIGLMRSGGGDGRGTALQEVVSLSALADRMRQAKLDVDVTTDAAAWPAEAQAIADTWLNEAIAHVLPSLEAVNCLINPDAILLGGRLPTTLLDRLAEGLNAGAAHMLSAAPQAAPVARAALSADAPAVGAAILPFSHFLLPQQGALWKASTTSIAGE